MSIDPFAKFHFRHTSVRTSFRRLPPDWASRGLSDREGARDVNVTGTQRGCDLYAVWSSNEKWK